jgi:DeoR/GlpR family transcriptional regulator of sugar metabolism
MIASQRQVRILELLRRQGVVAIAELTEAFAVSAMTVRRDLDELGRQGLLQRIHGGAIVSAPTPAEDPTFTQRQQIQAAAKQAIARAAAGLVPSRALILLDSGSTVAALAPLLASRTDVSVLSYSLPALQALAAAAGPQLIAIGGSFDPTINAFVGPLAEEILNNVRVEAAFLGASSVSAVDGFSNSSLPNLALQRIALRTARSIYLLADSTKLNRPPFWIVAGMERVTALITDVAITPEARHALEQHRVRLIIADDS